jgi:hypothetical protein
MSPEYITNRTIVPWFTHFRRNLNSLNMHTRVIVPISAYNIHTNIQGQWNKLVLGVKKKAYMGNEILS